MEFTRVLVSLRDPGDFPKESSQVAKSRAEHYRGHALLAAAFLAMWLLGCGETTVAPEDSYDPVDAAGTVDESLPRGLRAKQEMLSGVFVLLQQGIEVDALADYEPGARFAESQEEFLEGTLNLSRWNFNGRPEGSDVPVVLFLTEDADTGKERRVERVYSVTGSVSQFTISRK